MEFYSKIICPYGGTVDTSVLETDAARCVGSSPIGGTIR